MRKYAFVLLLTFSVFAFAASCGQENEAGPPDGSLGGVSDEFLDNLNDYAAEHSGSPADEIDVDLSGISSLVVHGEVNKILSNPLDYVGKRIRMSGPYYHMVSQDSTSRYHYIAVERADACCVRSLEFVWKAGDAFPDGYPQDWDDIEVTGMYGSYTESGETYYYIAVEKFIIL